MSYVRPLCWHSEIPWILFSGGWDANVKVWNTLSNACIYTVIDHHSDIYAIACHPSRPNLFITGSRDNSIRLWDFTNFLDETQVPLICEKKWKNVLIIQMSCLIFGKWENKFKENIVDYENLNGSEIFFCGKEGKNILKLYKELNPNLNLMFYHKVFSFFSV
jgi:WD40 repeat protein